jgi:hypothetical protein
MNPATQEANERGWMLAPARLPRTDVAKLRRLYHEAHAGSPRTPVVVSIALHFDLDDPGLLALAKLGVPADHVLVSAGDGNGERTIVVKISAHAKLTSRLAPPPARFALSTTLESRDEHRWVSVSLGEHRFRRTTSISEWTRILGRRCRHARGVLAHLRTSTLAEVFANDVRPGSSKVP